MILGCLVFNTGLPVPDMLRKRFPGMEIRSSRSLGDLAPLGDLDALVVSTPLYTQAAADRIVAECPHLRWLQSLSAGVDVYLSRGMPSAAILTNAQGVHAGPVADHAMGLLLALARCLVPAILDQPAGLWRPAPPNSYRGIAGERVVVLGYGPIGRAVASRLKGFGAEVVVVNRSGKGEGPADRVVPSEELRSVLGTAAAAILCLPDTVHTRHIFGAAEIAAMPETAFLINVGRGSTLDEDALLAALRAGRIAGAALDVMSTEPLPPDHPFWRLPNILLTPHVAAFDHELSRRVGELTADNLERLIAGRPLVNIVEGAGVAPSKPALGS